MKGILAVFLVTTLVVAACAKPDVKTKRLPKVNPTAYVYTAPLEDVRAAVLRLRKLREQLLKPPKEIGIPKLMEDDPYSIRSMTFETIEDGSPFSASVFKNPANRRDVYLHSFHSPVTISAIYFRENRPLLYIASFHIHLIVEAEAKTRVEIYTHEPEVIARRSRLPGVHGGHPYKYVKVAPTTVEEYLILQRLGTELGAKDMPQLVLPE